MIYLRSKNIKINPLRSSSHDSLGQSFERNFLISSSYLMHLIGHKLDIERILTNENSYFKIELRKKLYNLEARLGVNNFFL
jgi:hypothetical protein